MHGEFNPVQHMHNAQTIMDVYVYTPINVLEYIRKYTKANTPRKHKQT